MTTTQVESILKSPRRLVGAGSRPVSTRKVSKFWPACLLALGALGTSLIGATPVQAHGSHIPVTESASSAVPKRAFQLYYEDLGAFLSTPDENKEDFMLRVGNFLAHYTLTTGWEACGMVQEADEGQAWAVRLITNGSQLGCAQMAFEQAGFTPLPESIHSHPAAQTLTATAQDQRLHPRATCGKRFYVSPYNFSDRDLSLGAGYLVIPAKLFSSAKLLHQSQGNQRKLGSLQDVSVRPDFMVAGVPLSQENVVFVPLAKAADVAPPPFRRCRNF